MRVSEARESLPQRKGLVRLKKNIESPGEGTPPSMAVQDGPNGPSSMRGGGPKQSSLAGRKKRGNKYQDRYVLRQNRPTLSFPRGGPLFQSKGRAVKGKKKNHERINQLVGREKEGCDDSIAPRKGCETTEIMHEGLNARKKFFS